MDITLLLDYSKRRPMGGPLGVAYDTVEGLKKNYRRLEKEDMHFHIMSTTGSSVHSLQETDEKYGNISYEFFRPLVPNAILSDVNYLFHIKKGKKKIDLLHSHDISGAFVGTLLKIPTILTLHGMVWKELDFYPGMYSKFTFKLHMQRLKYASRRLKKLIAISPYVTREIDQFLTTGVPDTEVIENPIADVFFEQEKQEKEGLIIYPAYVNPLKNQYTLIEALSRLKKDNIRFHCILPGLIRDSEYYTRLQKLIHSFHLEEDVTIPGPLPLEQMLRLYTEASIMVMTSYQETAPLIIAEAMATGTPVIASRVSGIPSMVSEDTSGLLIDPHDPQEIADKIELLLHDRALRTKMQKESRKIALSRWKSEVITDKLIDLYLQQG
jgi:glycosyltransferase involved in cell wall biosynthesis